LERFGGTEVKSLGDGFLGYFSGPVAAVGCATDVSTRVAHLGLQIRAGIHSGEVEIAGDDIAGLTVNLAARITPLAGAGEVLVSRASRDLLVDSGISCHSRGVHALKGIPGKTEVFLAGPREASSITDRKRLRLSDRATLTMSRRVPALARFAGKLAGAQA
jgi:class 3 adenylate cyclase